MQWAWRNGKFWNGKMIVCTVITSYHKCQSYLTARQNKSWPQFEAIKLHSNQNKNKKPLSQMYFFVFTGNCEAAQPQWIRDWAKLQVSLFEDSALCPLCFLWTAGTFWEGEEKRKKKKEREEQASTQNFLSKSRSRQPGQREAGIALQRPGAITELVWRLRYDLISTDGHFVYGIKSITSNEQIDLAHKVPLHYFSKI